MLKWTFIVVELNLFCIILYITTPQAHPLIFPIFSPLLSLQTSSLYSEFIIASRASFPSHSPLNLLQHHLPAKNPMLSGATKCEKISDQLISFEKDQDLSLTITLDRSYLQRIFGNSIQKIPEYYICEYSENWLND